MRCLLLTLCVLLVPSHALAHRFAPSLLQLFEVADGEYRVLWKTPRQRVSNVPLAPLFPAACTPGEGGGLTPEGTGVVETLRLACPQGISGGEFAVTGLAENRATALFSLETRSGLYYQALLTPEAPSYTLQPEPGVGQVAGEYTRLGAEHIWEGPDHLMFVFGLFLLVGWNRKLFYTVSAFTVGHSITLSMVTLGLFDYPVALVEFMIAFSIFLLAVELAKEGVGWFRRYPWWLAGGFGLLHGMGFAGALAEVGLPQSQLPAALLFFNVGIELGQLAFIALVALVSAALRRISSQAPPQAWRAIPVYALGSLSALWCLERGSSLF